MVKTVLAWTMLKHYSVLMYAGQWYEMGKEVELCKISIY